MEDLLRVLIAEQIKTRQIQEETNKLIKEMSITRAEVKDSNELLTIEQVHKEFNIGICMVRKMFQDSKLPVQRYTSPFKVTRKAIENYLNEKHDYLSEN